MYKIVISVQSAVTIVLLRSESLKPGFHSNACNARNACRATGNFSSGIPGNSRESRILKFPAGIPGNFEVINFFT